MTGTEIYSTVVCDSLLGRHGCTLTGKDQYIFRYSGSSLNSSDLWRDQCGQIKLPPPLWTTSLAAVRVRHLIPQLLRCTRSNAPCGRRGVRKRGAVSTQCRLCCLLLVTVGPLLGWLSFCHNRVSSPLRPPSSSRAFIMPSPCLVSTSRYVCFTHLSRVFQYKCVHWSSPLPRFPFLSPQSCSSLLALIAN